MGFFRNTAHSLVLIAPIRNVNGIWTFPVWWQLRARTFSSSGIIKPYQILCLESYWVTLEVVTCFHSVTNHPATSSSSHRRNQWPLLVLHSEIRTTCHMADEVLFRILCAPVSDRSCYTQLNDKLVGTMEGVDSNLSDVRPPPSKDVLPWYDWTVLPFHLTVGATA